MRRRWLGWLPDRCSCGVARFDRCPDAVTQVVAGEGQPLGGPSAGAKVWAYNERYLGDPTPRQAGRW